MDAELRDIGAERALLGGLARYGSEMYHDVSDILKPESFYLPENQVFYECLEHHLKEGHNLKVDLPIILSSAKTLGYLGIIDNSESKSMLRVILNTDIDKQNIRKIAVKLRKLHIARELLQAHEKGRKSLLETTGEESVVQIINSVESPIFEYTMSLRDDNMSGPCLIGESVRDYVNHLKTNPRKLIGISTGFPQLDVAIGGGLRRKTVNIIGARPKRGKTSLVNSMCLHIAGKLGIPVFNLDTEMTKEDQLHRMIANLSGVPIHEIENGQFVNDRKKDFAVGKAADEIAAMPYHYMSIAGQPFEETLSVMRRWISKEVGFGQNGQTNDCVIFFDYIKLMDSAGLKKDLKEYQELGFIMTGLHNFMVKYSVPCQSFIQLNRDGIDKETDGVVSGSDRIGWFCSNFSIFKEKSMEEIAEDLKVSKEKYNRKLIPILLRHGGGLEQGDYINMNLNGAICKISEGPTRNSLHDEDIVDRNKGGEFHDNSDF